MDPNLKIEDLKNFNPPEPAVPKKPTPEQKTGEGHVEAAVPVSCTELEQKWMLFEKRMDYGWNFFDFHAKQRMTCFNFFLIFVGFVLNAYATFFKDRNFLLAGGMAFTAAGLSLLFIFLDRRNEELVYIAEDVLESLETDVLFSTFGHAVSPRHRNFWGIERKTSEKTTAAIFLRERREETPVTAGGAGGDGPKEYRYKSPYKHGRWLPRFQGAIMILFVAMTLAAIFHAWIVPKDDGSPVANGTTYVQLNTPARAATSSTCGDKSGGKTGHGGHMTGPKPKGNGLGPCKNE